MLVLGTVVDQEEEPGGGQALHQAIEQGLRLGVDPVQVLTDEQQGLLLALAQQHALEGIERALAALGWIEFAGTGCPPAGRPGGTATLGACPGGSRRASDLPGQLGPDGAGVIMVLDMAVAPEQVDDREVRRRLAIGHGGTLQHRQPWCGGHGRTRRRAVTSPRRLPRPWPPPGHAPPPPAPAPAAGPQLRLPAHEAGEPPRRAGLQTPADRTGPGQLKDLHGLGEPLDGKRPQGGDLDEALGQPEGRRRQPDTAWGGELLHTRGQVRGLAHGGVVHVQVVANRPHDDVAGMEPHARLHLQAVRAAHLSA